MSFSSFIIQIILETKITLIDRDIFNSAYVENEMYEDETYDDFDEDYEVIVE